MLGDRAALAALALMWAVGVWMLTAHIGVGWTVGVVVLWAAAWTVGAHLRPPAAGGHDSPTPPVAGQGAPPGGRSAASDAVGGGG